MSQPRNGDDGRESPKNAGPRSRLQLTGEERSRLVEKYSRERDRLNKNGVFGPDANNLRAQTMMQFEIGRIIDNKRRGVGGASAQRRRSGSGSGAGLGKDAKGAGKDSTRIADVLQQHLDSLHETLVADGEKAVRDRRERDRIERVRVVLGGPANEIVSGGPSAAAAAANISSGQPSNALGGGVGGVAGGQNRTPAQAVGAAVTASAAVQRLRSTAQQSTASGTLVRRLQQSISAASFQTIDDGASSTAPTAGGGALNAAEATTGGGAFPQRRELQASAPSPASGATGSAAPLGVADWMQRALEHAHYPDAEAELRMLHRKRDEPKRGVTPVDRYTSPWMHNAPEAKNWAAGSAKLLMEEIFVPTSLSEYQRAPPNAAPSAVAGAAATAATHLARDDFSRVAQDHDALLAKSAHTRARRARLRHAVHNELASTQAMLQPSLHVAPRTRASAALKKARGGSFRKHSNSGSDDDESVDDDDDENSCGVVDVDDSGVSKRRGGGSRIDEAQSSDEDGDDTRQLDANNRNSVRALTGYTGGNPDLDACDLVECVVVCLCEETRRKPDRSGHTRDVAVLRNVLVHALLTLRTAIVRECAKRKEFSASRLSGGGLLRSQLGSSMSSAPITPRDVGAAPTATSFRLLRSWTKGLETLLTLDLGLGCLPFSVANESHVDSCVRHYCVLHATRKARTDELMTRWRANRDVTLSTQEALGSVALSSGGGGGGGGAGGSNAKTASHLIEYFQTVSRVTADDLSKLEDAEANVKFRQRELAQAFLQRFQMFYPEGIAGASTNETDKGNSRADFNSTSDSPGRGTASPRSDDGIRGGNESKNSIPSTMAKLNSSNQSTMRLRTVLLRYIGMQSGGNFLNSSQAPAKSVTAFLNVFKTTWGRTPLSNDVASSEAASRAHVIENGNLITLIDTYLSLLSPSAQDDFRRRVRIERQRTAQVEERLREEAKAFSLAAAATSAQDAELAERVAALHTIERQQLLDKYTAATEDQAKLERLRRAIEASDEWFQYEASRKETAAAIAAAAAVRPHDGSGHGQRGGGSNAQGGTSPTGRENSILLGNSAIGGTSDLDPSKSSVGGGSYGSVSHQNRMEVMRIKRLQELEGCWQGLKIAYTLRIPLHDKWNMADLKSVDKAVRLYKECLAAVNVREAALEAVFANEKNPDGKERAVLRHSLFSEMCAAGQTCELLGRRLQQETGDTLLYQETMYTIKLKEDFAVVSKLLRGK